MTARLFRADAGTHGEILRAAFEVFARKGYDAGTMRDIAARVGVTEPAIYRHFDDKEALFRELLEQTCAELRSRLIQLLDSIEPSRVHEGLESVIADRRAAIRVYAPALRTILVASSRDEALLAMFREEFALPARTKLAETVARVDEYFGVVRDSEESASRVRALMSISAGTMLTAMVLGDEPEASTADAIVRIMGWM